MQADFQNLIVKTLNEPSVLNETINVLDFVLKNPKSEQIMATYLNSVFLRPDILKGLTDLLKESTVHTIEDKKV